MIGININTIERYNTSDLDTRSSFLSAPREHSLLRILSSGEKYRWRSASCASKGCVGLERHSGSIYCFVPDCVLGMSFQVVFGSDDTIVGFVV